jgi:hypothetical protein
MTVGVSSNQSDVGGSAGEHQNQLAHGGSFNTGWCSSTGS